MSDPWGVLNKLGGMPLANAGAGPSLVDLFSTIDTVSPEQDVSSNLDINKDTDPADNMFAIAPYMDDSSSSAHPLPGDDWLPPNFSADGSTDDREGNLAGSDNYVDDDGMLIS